MARIMGKRTTPAREYEVIEKLTCSLCGREAPRPFDNERARWANSTYDIDSVTIERSTGCSFPEGGNKEVVGYDVCPHCWSTKVVPFFKAHGAEPYEKESDW